MNVRNINIVILPISYYFFLDEMEPLKYSLLSGMFAQALPHLGFKEKRRKFYFLYLYNTKKRKAWLFEDHEYLGILLEKKILFIF